MVLTVQTLLRSQLACNEMQASARTCGRRAADTEHDRKCRLKSSQYTLIIPHRIIQLTTIILGLRDKAALPTNQQINKFPPKRVKNLATPSSIFFLHPQESSALSQSEAMDRPIGRIFPEHVERSFLDPEYSFAEYFQLGSRRKHSPS